MMPPESLWSVVNRRSSVVSAGRQSPLPGPCGEPLTPGDKPLATDH